MKKTDLQVLTNQLGRAPRNVVSIEARCNKGYPQVITTNPLLTDQEPPGIFPTTYWLTCPALNYRISKLEEAGWIKKLESEVEADKKLKTKLKQAHEAYRQDRLDLISEQKKADLKNNYSGQHEVLVQSGVGGILGDKGLKCLHTHYAHYLVTNNPIGARVDEILSAEYKDLAEKECEAQCFQGGSDCE